MVLGELDQLSNQMENASLHENACTFHAWLLQWMMGMEGGGGGVASKFMSISGDYIIHQMALFPFIANILHISIKLTPLCSPSSSSIHESKSTSLAPLLAERPYSTMLFILEMMHLAASMASMHKLSNKQHNQIS